MTPFEFFISFYGLVLGLCLTVLARGVARALKHRRRTPVGWLTPLLAIFVALDISTFWSSAWSTFRLLPYSYGMLVISLAIALVYFIAASLVFPETEDEVTDLDDHFWSNKRAVLVLVILSNALAWVASIVIAWPSETRDAQIFGVALNAVFFLGLTVPAALAKRPRLFAVLIGFQVCFYVVSAALLAYQPQWGEYDPDGDGVTQAETRAAALPAAPEAQ